MTRPFWFCGVMDGALLKLVTLLASPAAVTFCTNGATVSAPVMSYIMSVVLLPVPGEVICACQTYVEDVLETAACCNATAEFIDPGASRVHVLPWLSVMADWMSPWISVM